jgi:hypothetical protein
MRVRLELEAELLGHALLQLLNQRLFELTDLAAGHADDVVMVLVVDMQLEARALVIGKMMLLEQTRLHEHAQRPVHRRGADRGIRLPHVSDQIVGREVLTDLEQPIENQPALAGGAQPSAHHHGLELGSQSLSLSQLCCHRSPVAIAPSRIHPETLATRVEPRGAPRFSRTIQYSTFRARGTPLLASLRLCVPL